MLFLCQWPSLYGGQTKSGSTERMETYLEQVNQRRGKQSEGVDRLVCCQGQKYRTQQGTSCTNHKKKYITVAILLLKCHARSISSQGLKSYT